MKIRKTEEDININNLEDGNIQHFTWWETYHNIERMLATDFTNGVFTITIIRMRFFILDEVRLPIKIYGVYKHRCIKIDK